MNPKQQLEQYLLTHPDYWEYENEMNEVARLSALCQVEAKLQKEYNFISDASIQVYA